MSVAAGGELFFVFRLPSHWQPKHIYVNKGMGTTTYGFNHAHEQSIFQASVTLLLSVWDTDLSAACDEKPQWEVHRPGVN